MKREPLEVSYFGLPSQLCVFHKERNNSDNNFGSIYRSQHAEIAQLVEHWVATAQIWVQTPSDNKCVFYLCKHYGDGDFHDRATTTTRALFRKMRHLRAFALKNYLTVH